MNEDAQRIVISSPLIGIEELKLSTRAYNSLKRARVNSVADLLILAVNDKVADIRSIGEQTLWEIDNKIQMITFVEGLEISSSGEIISEEALVNQSIYNTGLRSSLDAVEAHVEYASQTLGELLESQKKLLSKMIDNHLLHPSAVVNGKHVADWILEADSYKMEHHNTLLRTLATISNSSLNVCEELVYILDGASENDFIVLIGRYGYHKRTLEEIASDIRLTRERVRQLANKVVLCIEGRIIEAFRVQQGVSQHIEIPALLKIQSALLLAEGMGLDITFEKWKKSLTYSGLLGICPVNWESKCDSVELMFAICNAISDDRFTYLKIPENLKYALRLEQSGMGHLPVESLHMLEKLSKDDKREITRHVRFCGAISCRWLSEDLEIDLEHLKNALKLLMYRELPDGWYVSKKLRHPTKINKNDVFHHEIRKMSQYCGPLSIDDVCAGLRHSVSRTDYPVPPPRVMRRVLIFHGYTLEDGLAYWDGPTNEDLTAGEQVILDCISENGPVVHHAELSQRIIESELSFPLLHVTLNRSPLFDRIDKGLYILRGANYTNKDINRAKAAAERTPMDIEVRFQRTGNIVVEMNVSTFTYGSGVIHSEQLPNLNGEWESIVHAKKCGRLTVTENEIRKIRKPLTILECGIGDRLTFDFNTWNRTVTIDKVV